MSDNIMNSHTKTAGELEEYKNKAQGVHSVDTECADMFEAMKLRRKYKFIIFKIGDFQIQVETAGERKATYEEFRASLPFTDCRYAVYDQDYTTPDGRPASKIWFLSWFPTNATPYNKMAYTTAKTVFRDSIPGVFDVMAASVEELNMRLGADGCGGGADNEEEEDDNEDFDF